MTTKLKTILPALFVLLGAVAALLWMGREAICKCGSIKLWHGVTMSSENSQHISDWYTFSHIIHGFIFFGAIYGVFRLLKKPLHMGWALFVATVIEAAWEIFENTDFVINRYRETTISLDYYGDSVLNSACDIGAMWLGFWMASKLPWKVTVALALAMELAVGAIIRDNLTLNVIMLIYPLEAIKAWQAGGV